VAIGQLKADSKFYHGLNSDSSYIKSLPVDLTMPLLRRGQERYQIYCTPCHGAVGDGKGIVTRYEYPLPPTSFHDERLRLMSNGEIFSAMSNGVRNMPSYKHQINVDDRWAIVGYLRALQRSQHAKRSDIPEEVLSELDQ
jgi:mono/diheme cytochrome c family protein